MPTTSCMTQSRVRKRATHSICPMLLPNRSLPQMPNRDNNPDNQGDRQRNTTTDRNEREQPDSGRNAGRRR